MHGVIFGAIVGVIVLALSFGITYVLYHEDEKRDTDKKETMENKTISEGSEEKILTSPLSGEFVLLEEVPDQVFSAGIAGKGVAIIPTVGKVVAPCDCEVSAIMDSGHAIALHTSDGMDLLIHVGLNTVELNGKYFEYKVSRGDKVKKGGILMEFDIEGIKRAGYKLHTPVLIANPDDFSKIDVLEKKTVKAGDALIKII